MSEKQLDLFKKPEQKQPAELTEKEAAPQLPEIKKEEKMFIMKTDMLGMPYSQAIMAKNYKEAFKSFEIHMKSAYNIKIDEKDKKYNVMSLEEYEKWQAKIEAEKKRYK